MPVYQVIVRTMLLPYACTLVMSSLHGQLAMDIWPWCWPIGLKLTHLWIIQIWAPSVNMNAEYPVPTDYDSMNNPKVCIRHWRIIACFLSDVCGIFHSHKSPECLMPQSSFTITTYCRTWPAPKPKDFLLCTLLFSNIWVCFQWQMTLHTHNNIPDASHNLNLALLTMLTLISTTAGCWFYFSWMHVYAQFEFNVVSFWKHVANWIGHLIQDQKVLSLIPSAGHVWKCRAKFVLLTASVHPSIMGTWCTDPRLDQ